MSKTTWTTKATEMVKANVEFWARCEVRAANPKAFSEYRRRRNEAERTLGKLVRRAGR